MKTYYFERVEDDTGRWAYKIFERGYSNAPLAACRDPANAEKIVGALNYHGITSVVKIETKGTGWSKEKGYIKDDFLFGI